MQHNLDPSDKFGRNIFQLVPGKSNHKKSTQNQRWKSKKNEVDPDSHVLQRSFSSTSIFLVLFVLHGCVFCYYDFVYVAAPYLWLF